MRGHIRERSPGQWAIVMDIRDPATGKRRRKWHSFSGTKRGAEIERSRLVTAISGGAYLEPSKLTLSAFLDQWLTHIRSQVAPRTFERYEELARKNIAPLLGQAVLMKLRPAHPQHMQKRSLMAAERGEAG